MGLRDALSGFVTGLRKGPVIAVNNAPHMIPASPGLGEVPVVNTLVPPTSANVPTRWAHTFLGPGQPFAGQIDQTTSARDAETEPRSMQYIANINSTITPRISWGLMPFSDLRAYARTVPEAAGAVRLLTEEMKSFIPSLVDDDGNDVTLPELSWMTESPDRVHPWPVWLSRFLYNVIVYDAPAIYKMRASTYRGYIRPKGNKGPLNKRAAAVTMPVLVTDAPSRPYGDWGWDDLSAHLEWPCPNCGETVIQGLGKVDAAYETACPNCGLEPDYESLRLAKDAAADYQYIQPASPVTGLRIVDGSTLFALIDERGEQPDPPAPAFTQVIWGVPRMFLNKNQIWYMPRFLQADSPYGTSFIEDSLPAVQLLQKLWEFEKDKYTSGNIPEMGMASPPSWTDADSILDYEDAFNARMAGNTEERAGRVRFFPNGMTQLFEKKVDFNIEGYAAAVNTIRMAAGIPKSEAGESNESSLGGKGFAEAMTSAFYRMGIAPLQTFIEGLFNDVIKENGYAGVKWKLKFPNESMDPEKEETKWATRFQLGGITRDEYREGLSIKKLGGEEGKFLVNPGGGQAPGEGEPGGDDGMIDVKKPGGMIPVKSNGTAGKINVLKNPVNVLQNPVAVKMVKAVMPPPPGVDPDEWAAGMQEELEHSDVTGGEPEVTAAIVAAHLKEKPDYYTRLREAMRKDGEAAPAGVNTGNAPNGVYLVGRDEESDELEKAANMTGVMIALPMPEAKVAQSEVTWPTGTEPEPVEQLHLTLVYYGEMAEQVGTKEVFFQMVEKYANECEPIPGKLNGVGTFLETDEDGKMCVWLNFDAASLPGLRERLIPLMRAAGFNDRQDHGFTPHVTLAYVTEQPTQNDVQVREVTVTHLRAAWGGEVHDFPFQGGLSKFDNVLAKHCGTCVEDDQYFGKPVHKPLDVGMPHQGANVSQIVSIGGSGLDPRPAVFKPQSGEKPGLVEWAGGPLCRRAEAAYLIDRELAVDDEHYLVPVTWCDEVDGEMGSIQHYVKGSRRRDPGDYDPEFVEQAAVFDYITGQLDRKNKNYLTHPDNERRPVLIDNDICCSPKDSRVRSAFVDAMAGKSLSAGIHEQLYLMLGNDGLWQDLEDCLDSPEAVEGVKQRVKRVYEDNMLPAPAVEETVEPAITPDPATTATPEELQKVEWNAELHPRDEVGKFIKKDEGEDAPESPDNPSA